MTDRHREGSRAARRRVLLPAAVMAIAAGTVLAPAAVAIASPIPTAIALAT